MALDPSLALQAQAPNPTNLISSFIDLGQKKINLDKSRATFDADVSQRQSESARAGTEASVAAATAPSRISEAQSGAGLAQFKLTGAQAQQSMQLASGLVGDPSFVNGDTAGMLDKLNGAQDTMIKQFGVDPKIADATITTLKYQAIHNPGAVRQSLINMTQQQQGGAGQQTAALPALGMRNDNQTLTPITQGNPALTGVAPNLPVGPSTQVQPSPSTPVIKNGVPSIYGAQPGLAVGGPTPQTDYAPGQREGVTGIVAQNNIHYGQVQQAAAGAADRVAGLNNIRQELPAAWSGGGEAGNFVRRLGQIFGNTDQNTAQDLIAKNLSQIASQGGATDAARTLTEMGNPGVHVTKDAAKEAVSQLIGVEAKKQAASSFFAGTPTNDPAYTNKLTMWNQYADPRAFQYAHLPPDEQAAMKAKMQKAGTWKDLNNNMSHLAGMGVNP